MDVTNRFILDFIQRAAGARPGARILDFGCGAGELVAEGRRRGLEVFGADVFYSGSRARQRAAATGLLGSHVLEIEGGQLPFPADFFHVITNNQVMEHVTDLEGTLRELHRVLHPDGLMLSIFPSQDVFREGHIGIPFAHWFPRDSRLRYPYTLVLRSLGFGYWKQEAATRRQWVQDKLRWLDLYTVYRSRAEIFAAFGKFFRTETRELEYIRYRMKATPGLGGLAWLAGVPVVNNVGAAVFRKLAFLVLLSRKKAP
ncbi:MAG: methyltransferase domain-containing protein [Bryobacteraceae bacterium]|nr:methyltransferase domain-containing protein [Bryobacteraceae bacterium]